MRLKSYISVMQIMCLSPVDVWSGHSITWLVFHIETLTDIV